MNAAVCTLFEGHYHLGAGALINSLYAAGFRGRMICGYRGALPPWAAGSVEAEKGSCVLSLPESAEIHFVPLETGIHFTNYKPRFLLDMWEGPAAAADTFYYLDPDIVVKCPWPTMERWADGGLGLCEDVNYYLPPRHPLRIGWTRWLTERGTPVVTPAHSRYYSGGFIGVPREYREFLLLWEKMIGWIGEEIGSLAKIKHGSAASLFHSMDQDAMNIALMASEVQVNSTGPEGMDFAHGGHLLSHAIGSRKPWRGGFVREALRGYPPSIAHKTFFQFTRHPLRLFTASEEYWLRQSLTFGAIIGRFYRRT